MDFQDFWNLYPRRMARVMAERAWVKMTETERFTAVESLPVHIRYWEAAGTTKEFLPYPATWLNQKRWADELEMPKPKVSDDWMRSKSGIEAKAKELGITPKLGEDWYSLKARIMARAA